MDEEMHGGWRSHLVTCGTATPASVQTTLIVFTQRGSNAPWLHLAALSELGHDVVEGGALLVVELAQNGQVR